MLKNFARELIVLIMKFLVFILHEGNRAYSAHKGKSLLKSPCIVISIVCSICTGPILNQEKQGRNQGKISDK